RPWAHTHAVPVHSASSTWPATSTNGPRRPTRRIPGHHRTCRWLNRGPSTTTSPGAAVGSTIATWPVARAVTPCTHRRSAPDSVSSEPKPGGSHPWGGGGYTGLRGLGAHSSEDSHAS